MAQGQVKLTSCEIHSTFYNDLFVLKTTITLNGQPAELEISKNGEIMIRCRYPELCFSFTEASMHLWKALKEYGVCQVSNIWYEATPFVQVSSSSMVYYL